MPNNELKNAIEHEELKASVNAIQIQISANADIQSTVLNSIADNVKDTLEQTKKTNGRVTLLESDMLVIRALKKHKWLFVLAIFGLMQIYQFISLEKVITKLLTYLI